MPWRIPLAFGFLLGAATARSYVEIGTRAASQHVNCGCQCSSLTFRDDRGNIHGNCRRADETGAQWCYVSNWSSSCRDLGKSQRFKSHWSYEACSTPPSRLCGNSGNYELGASFGEGSNGRGTGTSRGQGSGFSGQGSGFSWGSSGKGLGYGTSSIGQGSGFDDGSFGQSSGFLDSSFTDFESGPIGHGSYGQGSGSGSKYNGYPSGSGSYSQGIGIGLYSQGSGSGSYNQGSGSGSQSQGPGSNSGGPIVGLLNDILNGGVG